jgi:hypothetical protein
MRALLKAVAILVASCQSSPSIEPAEQWQAVEEYGVRVAFPGPIEACQGLSWTHLHGWGMPIEGTCKDARRSMGVWADWNASFDRSPEEAAYCSRDDLERGARLGLSFPGRRSATCRTDDPGGGIHIKVATQAWRWRERDENPDPGLQAPRVNYSAYLVTTPATFEQDLGRFRAMLRTVQIFPPAG